MAAQLVGCLLRRARVCFETLDALTDNIRNGKSLEEVLFSEKVLDLAPDIFPPHLVRAYIEKDPHYEVRGEESYDAFFKRHLGGRKKTTHRIVERQLRSAAKADATRRTAMVHQVNFRDDLSEIEFVDSPERYFVFLEPKVKSAFQSLSDPHKQYLQQQLNNYEDSTGRTVPESFFVAAREFQQLGLGVQREIKHKYPFHGLLYGPMIKAPISLLHKFTSAGDLVLSKIQERLPDGGGLFFSIDFFGGEDQDIFISSDIHDQQIGFGIQQQLGVAGEAQVCSQVYFSRIAASLRTIYASSTGRVPLGLNYDVGLYTENSIIQMEIDALSEFLCDILPTLKGGAS